MSSANVLETENQVLQYEDKTSGAQGVSAGDTTRADAGLTPMLERLAVVNENIGERHRQNRQAAWMTLGNGYLSAIKCQR